MKKLSVRVDDEAHRRLKIMAAERGESLQRIAARLLLEDLRRWEQDRPRRERAERRRR